MDDSDSDDMRPRFWQSNKKPSELSSLKKAIIGSADIDVELAALLETHKDAIDDAKCDAFLATTSSELKIPVHRFVLTGRSRVLRRGFRALHHTYIKPHISQEEAAKFLDIPFSSYRRHLAEGIASVIAALWRQETGNNL